MLQRVRYLSAVPVVVGLVVLGFTGAAAAAPLGGSSCAGGVLGSGTYSSLSIPPGYCLLAPNAVVTVTHPVTLASGAILVVGVDPSAPLSGTVYPADSVRINGPLTLGDSSGVVVAAGTLHVSGPVLIGTNAVLDAVGNGQASVSVSGGVTVQSHGVLIMGDPGVNTGSAIQGPVRATDPSTVQISTTNLSGPINVQGGGGSNPVIQALPGTQIGYNTVYLVGDTVSGPVTVQGFGGNIVVVEDNSTAGGLTVTDNSLTGVPSVSFLGGWEVSFNTVAGNARCSNNSPFSNGQGFGDIGGANTVSGHNTCG